MKQLGGYFLAFLILLECLLVDFAVLSDAEMWPPRIKRYWALVSDHSIDVKSVSFNAWTGAEVRKLSIGNAPNFTNSPLLDADDITIQPSFTGGAHTLIIRKPSVLLERRGGKWNVSTLIKLPPKTDNEAATIPESHVIIENGSFIVRNFDIGASEVIDNITVSFQTNPDGAFKAHCTLSTELCDNFEISASGNLILGDLKVSVRMAGMEPASFIEKDLPVLAFSPALKSAFEPFRSRPATTSDSGKPDVVISSGMLGVEVDAVLRNWMPIAVTGAVILDNFTVQYGNFPTPLCNLYATIDFDNTDFSLSKFFANLEGALISAIGAGSFSTGAFGVQGKAANVPLGRALERALGDEYGKILAAFGTGGKMDVSASVSRADLGLPIKWQAAAAFGGNVSATYEKFPYHVENISGEITATPGNITFTKPLESITEGSRIKISGYLGFGGNTGLIRVEAYDVPIDEKLAAALRENARKILSDFNAAGTANVVALAGPDLSPDCATRALRIEIDLSGRTSIKPVFFPLLLKNLKGKITIDSGLAYLDGAESGYGNTRIYLTAPGNRADRRVVYRGETAKIPLETDVVVENLPVDYRLKAALPESARAIFERLDPSGLVDAVVGFKLKKMESGGVEPEIVIDALVKSASVTPAEFPYAIENVSGVLRIADGRIEIRDFSGGTGGLRMNADGVIVSRGNETEMDLSVSLNGLRFDEKLKSALDAFSESAKNITKYLSPGGTLDARLRIAKQFEQKEPNIYLDIIPRDARVRAAMEGIVFELEKIRGLVTIRDKKIVIHSITAEGGNASFRVWGDVEQKDNSADAYIRLAFGGLPVERMLNVFSPVVYPSIHELARTFAFGGTLGGKFFVKKTGDAPMEMNARLELSNGSLNYTYFPVPVSDLSGSMEYSGGDLTITELRGKALSGDFLIANASVAADARTVALDIAFSDILIDCSSAAAFPAAIKRIVDSLSLSGRFSGHGHVVYERADRPVIALDLMLEPDNLSLSSGMAVRDVRGSIRIKCRIVNFKDIYLDEADVYLKNFRISEVACAWLSGNVVLKDHFAGIPLGHKAMGFVNIRGNFYDGLMSGFVVTHADNTLFYHGALRVDMAQMSMMAQTLSHDASASGSIDLFATFFGNSADIQSLAGRGYVLVRRADAIAVPFFNALSSALGMSGSYFDKIYAEFHLFGPALGIRPMYFRSSAITLSGEGIIDFNGEADILLDAYPAMKAISYVPGLREAWATIWQAMYKIRVKGKIPDPSVAVIPMGVIVESPYDAYREGRKPRVIVREDESPDEFLPLESDSDPMDFDDRFTPGR